MKVVLISIDALIYEDLKYFSSLKSFGSLLSHSLVIPKIKPVFPTHTYVCHTSIMTGCYPDKTGIISNTKANGDWNWYRRDIKTLTLTDILKQHGYKTASVCFPVTASADIDYLVPEIWGPTPDYDATTLFKETSSIEGFKYYQRYKRLLDWMRTPGMDNFAASCFTAILAENDVDFGAVHLSYLDHQRHKNGAESEKNLKAMEFIDQKLEEIFSVLSSDTTVIILGDHGHRSFEKYFSLKECLLAENIDKYFTIYDASYMAYLKSSLDEKKAKELILQLTDKYPIECVMTREEAKEKYHLDGDFTLALTTKDNYTFSHSDELYSDASDNHSSHGFLSEKPPFSPLIISNYSTNIKQCDSVDIAPTILSLFNINDVNMDGKVLPITPTHIH